MSSYANAWQSVVDLSPTIILQLPMGVYRAGIFRSAPTGVSPSLDYPIQRPRHSLRVD